MQYACAIIIEEAELNDGAWAPLPYLIVYGVQSELVHIFRVIHTSEE